MSVADGYTYVVCRSNNGLYIIRVAEFHDLISVHKSLKKAMKRMKCFVEDKINEMELDGDFDEIPEPQIDDSCPIMQAPFYKELVETILKISPNFLEYGDVLENNVTHTIDDLFDMRAKLEQLVGDGTITLP